MRITPALLAATLLLAPIPARSFPPVVFEQVEEFRLDNGMMFLLLARPETPSISGHLMVRVGNVDNPIGRTGLAHMFEHMAFQGTDRIGTSDWDAEREIRDDLSAVGSALAREVGRRARSDPARIDSLRVALGRLTEREAELVVPMEFPRVYDRYTLDFNAWTSVDFTTYWADLPANHLEVWMLMESERLQHPVFREFESERQVVMEERRENVEQDPVRAAWEVVYSLAFLAHPYRFPTIGYMSDLETLTLEEAEEFHRTYYVPGNCVAALVGDIDPSEAKRMIRDYFGDIPPGPPPPEVTTVEPSPQGIRRAVVRQGSQRRLFLCFPGAEPGSPHAATAELLASALGRDATSRLIRRLDVEERAAGEISVSSDGGFRRYPGVFEIEVGVLEGFTNERVEEMVWEELAGLVEDPVPDTKLDEIRRSYRNAYYRGLETNHEVAAELARAWMTYGDWRESYERFERYDAVRADDVAELAAELFREDLATVVYLEPEDSGEGSGS